MNVKQKRSRNRVGDKVKMTNLGGKNKNKIYVVKKREKRYLSNMFL